mmetsp:Transcript_156319/g.501533  ORF Transcript_156319/g.501533 Transcript_156319/m.501533 type:complete len:84 (+) Transcript_156319:2-253(+)
MIAGKVQDYEGIQPDHLQLTFVGEQLEDDKTLSDYNLPERSTLRMAVYCVCGRALGPSDNFCASCGRARGQSTARQCESPWRP